MLVALTISSSLRFSECSLCQHSDVRVVGVVVDGHHVFDGLAVEPTRFSVVVLLIVEVIAEVAKVTSCGERLCPGSAHVGKRISGNRPKTVL